MVGFITRMATSTEINTCVQQLLLPSELKEKCLRVAAKCPKELQGRFLNILTRFAKDQKGLLQKLIGKNPEELAAVLKRMDREAMEETGAQIHSEEIMTADSKLNQELYGA